MKKHVVSIIIGAVLFNIAFCLLIPQIPNPQNIGLEVYHSRFLLLLVAIDLGFSAYAGYKKSWAIVIVLAVLILLNLLLIASA